MTYLGSMSYDELRDSLLLLSVVQARLLPLFLLLPFMNRNMVPRTIATAIASALGLIIVPTLPPLNSVGFDTTFLMLLGKEAIIGLVMGYVAAIPFWTLEAVGFVVDNQRGASMAATINPMTGHDTSPLGILFNYAFITYFMVSGGLLLLLSMIYDSYRLWPPLSFWPNWNADAANLLLVQLNRFVMNALLLAAPVLLAMFLAELGLALVSRFAPQLQVFFLAMPIKSALGIFVLIVYGSTLFDYSLAPVKTLRDWPVQLDEVWKATPQR
jgi:type III secretion protein T